MPINKQVYKETIEIQDDCNLSGVVHFLVEKVLPAIREEDGYKNLGMRYYQKHPLLVLVLSKMTLAWISPYYYFEYIEALKKVTEIAEGE